MGVNGEALQPCAVYKKPYFLLQITWESISVLQVSWESASVLQVTWESIWGTTSHMHCVWTCNEIEGSCHKIITTIVPSYTRKTSLVCCRWHCYSRTCNNIDGNKVLLVAYWLKHWTADRKVRVSSPTCSRDLFLFWVYSARPQELSTRFSFTFFRGDVKPLVPGTPLKLA